ncbi:MAG: hypothetical protein AAFQ45_13480 [Pseudomonadota bacterium]
MTENASVQSRNDNQQEQAAPPGPAPTAKNAPPSAQDGDARAKHEKSAEPEKHETSKHVAPKMAAAPAPAEDTGASEEHTDSDFAKASDAMQEAIDSLGASVVRLKRNQVVEGQEAVEELEARYMRLRREFETYRQRAEEHEREANNGDSDVSQRATDTLSAARETVNEKYTQMKDYVTDENNQAAFKKSAKDLQSGFVNAWGEMSKSFSKAWQNVKRANDDRPKASVEHEPADATAETKTETKPDTTTAKADRDGK